MYAGVSGEFSTRHEMFIVEPLSMYKSGAPIISVDGSKNTNDKKNSNCRYKPRISDKKSFLIFFIPTVFYMTRRNFK